MLASHELNKKQHRPMLVPQNWQAIIETESFEYMTLFLMHNRLHIKFRNIF